MSESENKSGIDASVRGIVLFPCPRCGGESVPANSSKDFCPKCGHEWMADMASSPIGGVLGVDEANETDCEDFGSRHCSTFAFTDEHVKYVQRYGGRCRDCADEDSVCPQSGLPCGESEKAIRYVLGAIEYGVRHQFIKNPNT